ncbi:MAG: hypothetical protein JNK64_19360 [Myxococcales bacterium]|nr:hypothetical protein [Myxococcales bacterium]
MKASLVFGVGQEESVLTLATSDGASFHSLGADRYRQGRFALLVPRRYAKKALERIDRAVARRAVATTTQPSKPRRSRAPKPASHPAPAAAGQAASAARAARSRRTRSSMTRP